MCISDKCECMTRDTFNRTQANEPQYQLAKNLLIDPDFLPLLFICLPADQSYHLRKAMTKSWGKDVDWLCTTAMDFCDRLVMDIGEGVFPHGCQDLRDVSVLILEDLQHISGREVCQIELYRLLKARLDMDKVTVCFSETGLEELRFNDDLIHFLKLGIKEAPYEND